MFTGKYTESFIQKTLQDSISLVGVGLHTGCKVTLFVRPGPPNCGIRFVRKDVPQGESVINARWHNVVDTQLCTVIGNEYGYSVGAIEHLMAAFRACGVDNAIVEVDGPEVPIMDGSAAPFVSLVQEAGVVGQAVKRRAILIHTPIKIRDEDKFALLTPDRIARVSVEIDFDNTVIGVQKLTVEPLSRGFKHDVTRARTFGFAHDIERLHSHGLALGGSLRNAVVVDGGQIVNREGLRFKDEFARHKALDCVGDLYLAGHPIIGHFYGYKPGHKLNNALLRQLFAQRQAWCYQSVDEIYTPKWQERFLTPIKAFAT